MSVVCVAAESLFSKLSLDLKAATIGPGRPSTVDARAGRVFSSWVPTYRESGVHVAVRCDTCMGPLVFLCARRETKPDLATVAAIPRFRRLGWLFVPDEDGGIQSGRAMHGTPGAIGVWTCPECAATRAT